MIFYTYMWLREDSTPYYVGKGSRARAFQVHRNGKFPAPPKERILIEPHISEAGAYETERFLIAHYGRKDNGTGILRNLTDGGDSTTQLNTVSAIAKRTETFKRTYIPSTSARKKISQAALGNKSFQGKKHTEKTKEIQSKMALGNKNPLGCKRSSATRERMRQAALNRKVAQSCV